MPRYSTQCSGLTQDGTRCENSAGCSQVHSLRLSAAPSTPRPTLRSLGFVEAAVRSAIQGALDHAGLYLDDPGLGCVLRGGASLSDALALLGSSTIDGVFVSTLRTPLDDPDELMVALAWEDDSGHLSSWNTTHYFSSARLSPEHATQYEDHRHLGFSPEEALALVRSGKDLELHTPRYAYYHEEPWTGQKDELLRLVALAAQKDWTNGTRLTLHLSAAARLAFSDAALLDLGATHVSTLPSSQVPCDLRIGETQLFLAPEPLSRPEMELYQRLRRDGMAALQALDATRLLLI